MERNLQEMLDSLPKNQQQTLIDHFVCQLLGKPTNPLVMPKIITVSNGGTLEERIALFASQYNIDPGQIDREQFLLIEEEVELSRKEVRKIIQDHFGKNNGGQRGKDDELLSLGKFLYTTGYNYTIHPAERPDFILQDETKQIGVEHTRLEFQKDREYFSELWNKYIRGALELIRNSSPAATGLVNLILDADIPVAKGKTLRDFKAPEIRKAIPQIRRELADYILAVISGRSAERPVFIKQFSYQPTKDRLDIQYSQEYFQRADFEDLLTRTIQNKEQRLIKYREGKVKGINQWWLLVVVDGVNYSSSFDTNNLAIKNAIPFSYDKIFILNAFTLTCFELAKEEPYLRSIAIKEYTKLTLKLP